MFFLRCAFWLSIVYASMSWAPGTLASAGGASDLIATGRAQAQLLVKTAAADAADLCTRNPRECLADVTRLNALIVASQQSPDADAEEPATTATVPLPVPDPRRRGQDAKLARAP